VATTEGTDATAEPAARGDESDGPSVLALASVVAYKQFVLLVRYPVNTATRFLTMIFFFALIFFGGRTVAGPDLGGSLGAVLVGFFVWTLAFVAYARLAWNVTREAQWGTLERLFMSPHGFGRVMWIKTGVNLCFTFLWAFATLLVMMLISGTWLRIEPVTVLTLGLLTLASIVGIGFLFAGLALLYKRIENVFQLVNFGFLGLIAAPVETYPLLKLLPLTHGSYLLRRAMDDGEPLWALPGTDLALLVVTSTVYLLAGYYCFDRCQRRARRLGLLGQY
jgi:ABC-2 type transport system permease protein